MWNTHQIPNSKYFIVENLISKWSVVPWSVIIFGEKLIRRREPWINFLISPCLSKWGYHFFPNRSVRSRVEELYFQFCLLDFDPFLFRIVFVFLFESFERLSFVCLFVLMFRWSIRCSSIHDIHDVIFYTEAPEITRN